METLVTKTWKAHKTKRLAFFVMRRNARSRLSNSSMDVENTQIRAMVEGVEEEENPHLTRVGDVSLGVPESLQFAIPYPMQRTSQIQHDEPWNSFGSPSTSHRRTPHGGNGCACVFCLKSKAQSRKRIHTKSNQEQNKQQQLLERIKAKAEKAQHLAVVLAAKNAQRLEERKEQCRKHRMQVRARRDAALEATQVSSEKPRKRRRSPESKAGPSGHRDIRTSADVLGSRWVTGCMA